MDKTTYRHGQSLARHLNDHLKPLVLHLDSVQSTGFESIKDAPDNLMRSQFDIVHVVMLQVESVLRDMLDELPT